MHCITNFAVPISALRIGCKLQGILAFALPVSPVVSGRSETEAMTLYRFTAKISLNLK